MNQNSAQRLRAGPGSICSRDGAQPVPLFSCQSPQIQQPLKVPSPPFSPPSWMETLSFPSQTAGQQFSLGKVFCRGDEGGMGEDTRDKLLRGARSDPKSPPCCSCASPCPDCCGGRRGRGCGGPGGQSPRPGASSRRIHPAPRRCCGCGPGLPVCPARFRTISKIII